MTVRHDWSGGLRATGRCLLQNVVNRRFQVVEGRLEKLSTREGTVVRAQQLDEGLLAWIAYSQLTRNPNHARQAPCLSLLERKHVLQLNKRLFLGYRHWPVLGSDGMYGEPRLPQLFADPLAKIRTVGQRGVGQHGVPRLLQLAPHLVTGIREVWRRLCKINRDAGGQSDGP